MIDSMCLVLLSSGIAWMSENLFVGIVFFDINQLLSDLGQGLHTIQSILAECSIDQALIRLVCRSEQLVIGNPFGQRVCIVEIRGVAFIRSLGWVCPGCGLFCLSPSADTLFLLCRRELLKGLLSRVDLAVALQTLPSWRRCS
jgi:hypothetical protein